MKEDKPVVLIPAYNPDEELVKLVNDIVRSDLFVIVVNDGSIAKSNTALESLRKIKNCSVLEHGVNLGKGRAIKTGINHVMINFSDSAGIVTADADGQHTVKDIMKVVNKLQSKKAMILGCRQFKGSIPLRSRIGNIITKYVFKFIIGKNISDTQTGLRGIPSRYFRKFMTLKGEKYEYEINVLAYVGKENGQIIEEPIDTIYIEGNKTSHFDPLLDSMRIYFVLFRFLVSSLTSSVVDYVLFAIFFLLSESLVYSAVVARGISMSVNYNINKSWVFSAIKSNKKSFAKFFALACMSLTGSCLLVSYLTNLWKINTFVVKMAVESALFLLNFSIQRRFVFRNDYEA
ncbi:MAG: bifunctional glycosyltransferase family 2/GtrA family protein [Holosporales bacterium]|jgi:putative flippase GtrA|nr:bifunctional glycosyltransferase family 2/GtrA family protein [Holosporales bacterium]